MTQLIDISELSNNTGQIPGLPKNPRLIKKDKFEKLTRSLEEDPEMLNLRELLVYPFNGKFIVIAGNMRLQAAIELGYDSLPCKVIPEETSIDKLKAITQKDNIPYGEDDFEALYNEWDIDQLVQWGKDISFPDPKEEPEVQEQIEQPIIKLEYSYDDYLIVKEQLSKIDANPEQAVWKLLGNK